MDENGRKSGQPPQKLPPYHFLEGDPWGAEQGGTGGVQEGGSDHICLQFSSSPPHPAPALPSVISQLPVLVRPRPPAWTSPADVRAVN